MKILFFILSFVLFATQVFAATEEVLFSCKGQKTSDGLVPIYKAESLRSGRWVSSIEAEGLVSEASERPDLVTISDQSKKENGCVLTLDQKINGKAHTLNLVYADKELTLRDKVAPNFKNAPCKIISKSLRQQLNDCKIVDREEVEQGLLCRSDSVDETEIHIRVDVNKDATYAERSIYQIYKGKGTKLGTKTAEITTNLIKDGNECVVEITEANQTKDNRLKLVIRLKKPFSDSALGWVSESKITSKNAEGMKETMILPDEFKNMKCEVTGNLSAKISECNVDTTMPNESTSPKPAKKSSSPTTQQNTKQ